MKTLFTLVPVCCLAFSLPAQTTDLCSTDAAGVQANDFSTLGDISGDGRYVVFATRASNLVPGDTNSSIDVFVKDRLLGTIERVSVDSSGAQSNGDSTSPCISDDGRIVAFESRASNLVSGDTNGGTDVFAHNRITGGTRRVSVRTNGDEADRGGGSPSLSADGRIVAFQSSATNLVAGDTNGVPDVFYHNRRTGKTRRVSVNSAGVQGNGASFACDVSADGEVFAFTSDATNLALDTNVLRDTFVHDRIAGVTQRVSVDSFSTEANGPSVDQAGLSADGRFVAFVSYASNLVAGDTNSSRDAFLRDRFTGSTRRVSVASGGTQADQSSFTCGLSDDGQVVCFEAFATNLVFSDTNRATDVFLHEVATSTTRRVNLGPGGVEADIGSLGARLSADGRHVVYASGATNLVPNDTNGLRDVFASGPELNLNIEPAEVALLDPVSFGVFRGDPGRPVVLFVLDVNGGPFVQHLFHGAFDAGGGWSVGATVPNEPMLQGLKFTLAAFGVIASTGKMAPSNTATLSIL